MASKNKSISIDVAISFNRRGDPKYRFTATGTPIDAGEITVDPITGDIDLKRANVGSGNDTRRRHLSITYLLEKTCASDPSVTFKFDKGKSFFAKPYDQLGQFLRQRSVDSQTVQLTYRNKWDKAFPKTFFGFHYWINDRGNPASPLLATFDPCVKNTPGSGRSQ